ncbi:MAG: hypothetical protein GXO48_02565 [Chlorobi bacterium]|nr:hypothetical protein [Chlorobiota bacterium]
MRNNIISRALQLIVLLGMVTVLKAQKTGVGSNPHARLDIHVPSSFSDSIFLISIGSNSLFLIGSNGSVAINKWVPTRTLDVNGTVRFRNLSGSNRGLVVADNNGVLYRLSETGSTTHFLNGNLQWSGATASGYLWQYALAYSWFGFIFPTTFQGTDTPYFAETGALDVGNYFTGVGLSVGGAVWQQASPTQLGVVVGVNAGSSNNFSLGQNVYVGDGSGQYVETAGLNTAIGFEALGGNAGSGAVCNTAIGAKSLWSVGSGSGNVALGYKSAVQLYEGDDNIVIGDSIMQNCTICSYNIAIGTQALVNHDNSFSNVAIGNRALALGTEVNLSVAIGTDALSNLSGLSPMVTNPAEVAIGDSALATIQNQGGNTAVGSNVLKRSVHSLYTTAIGHAAMAQTKITEGSTASGSYAASLLDTSLSNVTIGYKALYQGTYASDNVAVGVETGSSAQRWENNVAVGYRTLSLDTLGSNNVAIGTRSMYFSRAAKSNVAVGYEALYSITGAVRNVAVGTGALRSVKNASNNVAIGNGALASLQNGFPSVAIGDSALASLTDAGALNVALGNKAMSSCRSCIASTAIGYKAMANAVSNASNNVAIGTYTLYSDTPGTQSVAIGNYAMHKGKHYNSVAIGYTALFNARSDTESVVIGTEAAQNASEIYRSLVVGYKSMSAIGAKLNESVYIAKTDSDALHNHSKNFYRNVVVGYVHDSLLHSNAQDMYNVMLGNLIYSDPLDSPVIYNTHIGFNQLWNIREQSTENVTLGDEIIFGQGGYNATKNVILGPSNWFAITKEETDRAVAIGRSIRELNDLDVLIGNNLFLQAPDIDSLRVAIRLNYNAQCDLENPNISTYTTLIDFSECYVADWGLNTVIGSFVDNAPSHDINASTIVGMDVENRYISPIFLGDIRVGGESEVVGFANVNIFYPVAFGYGSKTFIGSPGTVLYPVHPDYAYHSVSFGAFATNMKLGTGTPTYYDYTIQLGDSNVTWIGGQVNWSTYSDRRFKTDIRDDVVGLDFINRLKPVSYMLKYDSTEVPASPVWRRRWTGFIAQDVYRAAKETNYKFSGVMKGKVYTLRYAEFVVPLTKAVQDQQTQIVNIGEKATSLKSELQELRQQLHAQKEMLESLKRNSLDK